VAEAACCGCDSTAAGVEADGLGLDVFGESTELPCCAEAAKQKNASSSIGPAASLVFNMTDPFPLAAMTRRQCLMSKASQVKFSPKLVAPLYNFVVIRFSQQSH
jgi:hypothetical protein